jgi:hypothetical protein
MRFREFQGGIQMPVSLEEEALIKKIDDSQGITEKDKLNERELELARKMVSRGLLNRFRTNEKTFYVVNGLEDLWRS